MGVKLALLSVSNDVIYQNKLIDKYLIKIRVLIVSGSNLDSDRDKKYYFPSLSEVECQLFKIFTY
jgi:hypothetical protein